MITRDILETAIYAPSGDNVQPWKFRIGENVIDIFNVPENDLSVYNFRQSASMIAHGALIENIMTAAAALGYRADPILFPDSEHADHVARVLLEKTEATDNDKNDIAAYIKVRATNRKPYKKVPLSPEEKSALLRAAESQHTKVVIIDERAVLKKLVAVTSNNERLVFSSKLLHDFFFRHMKWTDKDAEGAIGFHVKTLELPYPARIIFKLCEKWSRVEFFNKLGLANVIAGQARKLHATSPAMGAIIAPDYTPRSFIETGRAMQRLWLEATRLGLGLQPITGILFFMQKIEVNEHEEFSEEQVTLIKDSYKVMEDVFGAAGGKITFLFRVGKSDRPSARTTRLPLDRMLLPS